MNTFCMSCHRYGIFKLGEKKYQCPWLDCRAVHYQESQVKKKSAFPNPGLLKMWNTKNTEYNRYLKENKDKKLSCIIAYSYSKDKNRQEALRLLMRCFKLQTFKNFELIVVEQVMDGYKGGRFPYRYLVDKHIPIYDKRPFDKSWVNNVGARVATTKNLIFHDADVLFGKTYLEKMNEFRKVHVLFSGWSSFRCMPGRDNPNMRIHVPKTISCLIAGWYCNKDFYWNVFGGYNEDYYGYGREDSDIWHRARYLMGKIPVMDYPLVHYYHHWHPKEGPNPLQLEDDRGNAILEKCMAHPEAIIEMLLKVKNELGNKKHPTFIHDEDWRG